MLLQQLYDLTITSSISVDPSQRIDHIFADATAGDITITVISATDGTECVLKVLKTDDTANDVEIVAGSLTVTLSGQNATATIEQDSTGAWHLWAQGGPITLANEYAGAGSFQPVAADLTLDAAAGRNIADGTAYLAPMMGNVLGADLTKTANYIGGLIGADSVTGAQATTFPKGAVLGQITDGVTASDGAFVAFTDGDSAQTKANAALKIMNNNSTAGSGFDWVIDGYDAAHDGFNAAQALVGFARIGANAGGEPIGFFFGAATDDAGIVAQVGSDALWSDGSLYVSAVAGAGLLFQKQNDVWINIS